MDAEAGVAYVKIAEGVEVSAKGVAMSAGIGVGLYKDHADAVAKAVRIVRTQQPIAENTALYDARYKAYRELLDVMQKPWDTLHALGNNP